MTAPIRTIRAAPVGQQAVEHHERARLDFERHHLLTMACSYIARRFREWRVVELLEEVLEDRADLLEAPGAVDGVLELGIGTVDLRLSPERIG